MFSISPSQASTFSQLSLFRPFPRVSSTRRGRLTASLTAHFGAVYSLLQIRVHVSFQLVQIRREKDSGSIRVCELQEKVSNNGGLLYFSLAARSH